MSRTSAEMVSERSSVVYCGQHCLMNVTSRLSWELRISYPSWCLYMQIYLNITSNVVVSCLKHIICVQRIACTYCPYCYYLTKNNLPLFVSPIVLIRRSRHAESSCSSCTNQQNSILLYTVHMINILVSSLSNVFFTSNVCHHIIP